MNKFKLELEIVAKMVTRKSSKKEVKDLVEEVQKQYDSLTFLKQDLKRYAFLKQGKKHRITREEIERKMVSINRNNERIVKLTKRVRNIEKQLVILEDRLERVEAELRK